ncbi:TonB-dependent receptor [Novosphingobium sp. KCTC 2891]|uniref:TonB-dependent receptor n=1 Tax=Novosphingobium sp. KCTC 2891 TaxID=2989730 RepID=UPI0022231C22|nr:TonB-dependent receptor [Novosphingobium sp. KCTC 2891]MCW1381377.1 TonB-dependent receptor [Novosphingobium sp. KCTC 2891]
MTFDYQIRAGLLAGAGAIALAASPAFAQTSISVAPAADATSADQSGGTYSSGLTEIVVTATKRETNLQKTPISISVMAPEALKDRHVQSLIDLADGVVPSLRVATFEARQSALTVGIRGIVPFDANQTARDTGVGVYIDGVYLGRSQGLNAALLDVERIEVLRGPQGTLFGRNTEGGAVSIVTRKPTGEFGGRVSAGAGNFGSYNGEIHLNLPKIANVAFKLDGIVQHQDPTVKNPLAGQAGWNQYDRKGGRITALWEPIDGFSVEMSYDRARDENTPFYSQLVNYNPNGLPVATIAQINGNGGKVPSGMIAPLSPLVTVSGDKRMSTADIGVPQQPSVDDTHGFTSLIKYKVSPALELRSITAWRGVDTHQWDNSGGAHRTIFSPNANFSRYSLSDLHQRQFSQELQAVGSLDSVDYVVGLYYFTENVREFAATPSTNKWNADGTGYTINDALAWNESNWSRQRDSNAVAHSYAAFAQATWTPVDPLHITVGGRYTKDKRRGTLTTVQNKPTNFPFTFDKDRFDPMVTVAYDVAPTVNVFAKYSTGYRAGGANSRSQTFAPFNPEVVKSYEIGAKMDLLDHRVRLNLAGYMMDRTGTQIDFDNVDTDPTSPTYNLHTEETGNSPGKSKIRGVEAELTVKPIDSVTLGASYAYTYTNVPATLNPFLSTLAKPVYTQVFVVFTPEHAAAAYADYTVPIGGAGTSLRFHVDANYASSMYSFQNETTKTQASFIVNGRVALADIPMNDNGQKLTLSAWARNLLNETHIYRRSSANANTLGDYANFNAPRTFGFDATVNF